ncbi:phosphoribosylaminoimidazolesuccinocarboxamide synthase [Flavobacteriaceae bacterium]|jgi:phosphoribosylaminoimidazole-succinocarboxamide synthase|nr:phosphoribosylaminoimidazolesuccinocarboxamide synthase [Flavobacteriaceae bacterium]MDB4148201.1 phosphoribosylaminoimidazolesuccinocarboxamide synthase [Flavobacteriaceae bacterium]MDB4164417.1 phosphoribosylaminoimidazolesuccinocarboxamide synthase [Flavobacteriaceae bacterium]MDB9853038.1 phosphoribosylaminoimidazolesuccinocarboxamide synthase [Flavobacteriaceae bacterium]MDC1337495.1 phosphoribosylaminoimidazolesuccinocarboxamide synthase [Flavobacteriaceae bacterium]|tara:strand:- start:599 stop:1546 length:948 start_codon:yes stop_codon:yes gene_type:complete
MNTLTKTDFTFPYQISKYSGKVREVYKIKNNVLVMISTDRLSAFDVVLPNGIPYKGQILNQIACKMLKATSHIVPNWLISSPDPNVSIGEACEPFKVEMVVRGYLSGHASRLYKSGKRKICGVTMPEGMIENDKFNYPIITPTTKAENGSHDEDISREEILLNNIVSEQDYTILEDYSLKLFNEGTRIAKQQGLILVDTKYEFGKNSNDEIILIDEIHTPDSSRYFYLDSYKDLQNSKLPQRQLSKEFVRQWLIGKGFQGKKNQIVPEMSTEYINGVSERYIELYEKITGLKFVKEELKQINQRIETNVLNYLSL